MADSPVTPNDADDYENMLNAWTDSAYGYISQIDPDTHAQTVICDDGRTIILRNIIERAGGAMPLDRVVLRWTKLNSGHYWVGARVTDKLYDA